MDNHGSSAPYRYPGHYGYPLYRPRSGLEPYSLPPRYAYPSQPFSCAYYHHPARPPGAPTSPQPSSPPSGSAEHIRPPPVGYYFPHPYPYPHYQVPQPPQNVTSPQTSILSPCNFQFVPPSYRYFPVVEAHPPPDEKIKSHSRARSYAGPYESSCESSPGGGASSWQTNDSSHTPGMSVYPLSFDGTVSSAPFPNVGQSSPTKSSVQLPFRHSNSVSISSLEGEFPGHRRNSFSGWGSTHYNQLDSRSSGFQDHPGSLNESMRTQNLDIVPASTKGPLKTLLLHGNLDMWVHEARNLPNIDYFHKTFTGMLCKFPGNVEGKITSNPYVIISVSNAIIGRTFVINNCENPNWMQHFNVPVAHYAAEVNFLVKDNDVVGSQIIGNVAIPVEQIYSGAKVEGTYPVLNSYGRPYKQGATLTLSIQYIPIEKLSHHYQGIDSMPDCTGVPGTYFPLRKGGSVNLYQDAHVPDGLLPLVMLDRGKYHVNGKCWADMFNAIQQARRLIYITGWSLWHKVRLVRDAVYQFDYTLGDLLRSKSQEGVRVLLLIWDDPTSRKILGYKTDGLMATHDEETRRFFKHSSVKVLLCPRIAGKRHSWYKQKEVGTIYTHHQKTVVVDADAGNNKRKIIAFVGGLDLCDGRYDFPHHPLFRTRHSLHKDDYHNPTFTGNTGGCPREPWHDLHSKIDGPAAYDVLTNFEERWLKATKPQGIKKLKASYDDALLKLERLPEIVSLADMAVDDDDPDSWHVQIFRSIDSNSVKGFPKDPKNATKKNLVCGKNVLIDMSIHTAYVKAIRAAQHYIYIENQYFIGSSYNWSQYKDLGANNLIPMEIALKIVEKIKANERFAVYIIIPMWPEGVPSGSATQRILFWQQKTMQMMYETVSKALVEAGLEAAFAPQDYLNFFCLGNREIIDMYDYSSMLGTPPPANSPQAFSRNSRRFMIYVHSKGMIVDDEYVILGSANINQRSMEGTRDTEIAMGAYQPNYTWARQRSYPCGEVHGYRMSLWAEHTGTLEECFLRPESLECVRRIRTMGEINWKQFAANEITEMRGHLLKYPVEVDRNGKVRSLPGHEEFPDVGGRIVGSFLAIQENLTI
ncbi:phospholipase D gamma 1-like [Neltuma alba]|uniref:phospholipase D gamma 1-like n=1 Tax=Neltuma alba TaxID=207710 RepID=UPI0010A34060|nr:phospholipase D gamma 1-like [Prosopis alba]